MIRLHRLVACLVILLFAGGVASAQQVERYEKELAAFDAADRVAPPPQNAVVFVGSSSIQQWDLAKAFPEIRTINRARVA